jgi:16S rRNA processing protein RimM
MASREQEPPAEGKQPLAETPGYVAVGSIVGPWGLHGDLKVEPLTDFPQRFAAGGRVCVGGVAYVIERCRWQRSRAVLKLAGIDSATAAAALRHRLLEVPQDELRPLGEGQYYHFQILGLEVRTTAGEILGRVQQIISTGSNDVFVVRGQGREVLIPAVEDVVKSVNLAVGRMEVEAVEGLLPPVRRRAGRRRPRGTGRNANPA